jgi:hypothetical protein
MGQILPRTESWPAMKFVNKLLHRESEEAAHQKWLAEHPGKGSMATVAPPPNAGYDQASRERMEKELAAQHEKLGK